MKYLRLLVILFSVSASILGASEHSGLVRIGQVPIPGAVVVAKQGEKTVRAVTAPDGTYGFMNLDDGTWTLQVEMPGFESVRKEVVAPRDTEVVQWDLQMLPVDEIGAGKPAAVTGFPTAPTAGLPTLQTATPSSETQDRLLINGSVSNGASTPFALNAGFGNNRRQGRSLYTGAVAFSGNNAVFDARSFSLTGQDTAKPAYSRVNGTITYGGPFKIPSLFPRNGSFNVTYTRTQNRDATLQTAQMPTPAQRIGDFSGSALPVIDPSTGAPFANNIIPDNRISAQAKALVSLYPLPNFSGATRFNYQLPVLGVTHGDNIGGVLQNFVINSSNRLAFTGGYQSRRSDNPDVFGFTDTNDTRLTNVGVTWTHRFTQRNTGTIRYQFSRATSETTTNFGKKIDVSGNAGITGNDRDPRNWGPPALNFSGGIARLSDGSFAFDRDQSNSISYSSTYIHKRHAFGYGADTRRQQFNLFSQQDARGSFTFTGAATSNDFADFLLGIPTASSLAFGNADKYFRQSFYNAYLTDDYKLSASLTLNLGVRFEYETPIIEKQGRLVNLDVAPGFTAATPKLAGSSNQSLIHPDKTGFLPRLGFGWRPRAASSLMIRGSYVVYRDTAVYRSIVDEMAQQSPLSKSLSVQNTPAHPLSLADGFQGSPSITATTFGIDPHFKFGRAQNWQLSIQGNLPQAMQLTVTYLGIKGTHLPQRFLPNSYAPGGTSACPSCPVGFTYLTSNGNSSLNAGTVELRRRQRNGFQASVLYTYSKAIDDSGIGTAIAQNWLNLRGERALSSFDQRHQMQMQMQYTPAMTTHVGGFWDGWRGALFKQWTIAADMTLSSGSPLTPVILVPIAGTGMIGSLRPDVTGARLYVQIGGLFLNPAAFTAPAAGQWGNAGRNTITGPGQLALNSSLSRTFRVNERVSMDLNVNATNVLNHVTFAGWNTIVNSSQFGLPTRAKAMRTLQPSLRVRF